MGWFVELLFGRPVFLLLCWAALQFVLICVWSARRDRLSAHLVWSGFAAIFALQIAALFTETRSERVVAVCRQMAKAVDNGEIAALAPHLHADFSAAGLDKDAFLEAVGAALSRYRVDNPRLRRFVVDFPSDDEALAVFNASCRVRTTRSYGHMPSRWRARLRENEGRWQLVGVESLPVPPLYVGDLRQWLR